MTDGNATARILSVDDDPDIQALVAHTLRGQRFDVVSAPDGRAGLEAARLQRPDLILLDAVMPGMSGFAVAEEMQSDPDLCRIPVVFLTALDGAQDRARAFALGAVDHLTKPFQPAELVATVQRHLETSARFRGLSQAEDHWAGRVAPADYTAFRTRVAEVVGPERTREAQLESLGSSELYSHAPTLGLGQSDIASLMAEFLHLKRIDAISHDQIDLAALPSAFCRKNLVVPIHTPAGPALVLSDPFNWDLVETVKTFWDPGAPFHLLVAGPDVILSLLTGAAAVVPNAPRQKEDVYHVGPEAEAGHASARALDPQVLATDGPVASVANDMLAAAVAQRASDIHIEPKANTTVVRFRIDGDLREFSTLDRATASMLISRLKALAELDIAERRRPQDGSFEAAVGDRRFKLRLATTSTPSGESLIVRLLEVTTSPRRLTELGMTPQQADRLQDLSKRSQGLILFVGSTGSGKTTTIYSLLAQVDGRQRSILSIEDPVEYRIPLANQQQVNERAGVTFESLLKSVVRQDPDVLFLGEIRDAYSAKMAVDFASTGHLTISSLHTTNATTAIFRLERLGVAREDMADAVLAIVAQRLVKRLCPVCRSVRPITEAERALLAPFTDDVPATVADAVGCAECDGTGYRGREAVAEVFEFDPPVQDMLRRGRPIAAMRESLRARGAELLADRAIARVRDHTFALRDVYDRVLAEELTSLAEGSAAEAAPLTPPPEAVPVEPTGLVARPPAQGERAGMAPDSGARASEVRAAILLVDDDPDAHALAQRALAGAGYDVSLASDGAEALFAIGSRRFDLIVADIAMPMLDGFSLLQVVQAQGLGVPLILLTGSAVPEDEARGLSMGAVDFIHKPVRRDVLLARVARVLDRVPAAAS